MMVQSAPAAIVIANYDFTSGSAASIDSASISDALEMTIGSGLSGGSAFSSNTEVAFARSTVTGSTQNGAITGDDYFSFTVDAVGGTLDLVGLEIDLAPTDNGDAVPFDATIFVMSDVGGFTTSDPVLDSITVGSSEQSTPYTYAPFSVDLSGAEFQGLSSITFRLYIFDDGNDATNNDDQIHRIDNVVLTAVPEPGALALVGLSFAGLAMRRRR